MNCVGRSSCAEGLGCAVEQVAIQIKSRMGFTMGPTSPSALAYA
jgi:hypothetical protein